MSECLPHCPTTPSEFLDVELRAEIARVTRQIRYLADVRRRAVDREVARLVHPDPVREP